MNEKDLIEAYKRLDTTAVSDALDKLGICGALEGIKPVLPDKVICGRAFTVKYIPATEGGKGAGDYIDDVRPGEVVVIDNGGRTYCTVWGDILSLYSSLNGIEGTVIDGVCRDIPAAKRCGHPIFSRGYYMSTGKDRVEMCGINVPVMMSGIPVAPGDLVFGDDSGVLIVPWDRAEEVLETAAKIEAAEEKIRESIKGGMKLKEARKRMNYDLLQQKEE